MDTPIADSNRPAQGIKSEVRPERAELESSPTAPVFIEVFAGQSMPDLKSAAPAREALPERLKEWETWKENTTAIVDGLGRGLDPGILPVIAGLNALGINTLMSCEGHLTPRSHPGPMVEIGAPDKLLAIRFEGQDELFARKLRDLSVPFLVRLANPLSVGISPLTPDMVSRIDTPELRRGHPKFWAKIHNAYTESLQEASYDIKTGRTPFTPEETARREANTRLLGQITALLDEFSKNREDTELTKPYLRSWEGQAFDLVFGNHPEGMPRDPALLADRQKVAAAFAEFLQSKFLHSA
jgi:hypothetical protein